MPFLETILAQEGALPWLPWHQARLDRTLAAHGIFSSHDLAALLLPPAAGHWRCRVLYDGDTARVEYLPYVKSAVNALQIVNDDGIDYTYKSADRAALEALFALRGAADDVLIVKNGLVTDTTRANVACRIAGVWYTPAHPLLEGTARARLLDEGKLSARDITIEEACRAERVAVMNALSGFVEVSGGILPQKSG